MAIKLILGGIGSGKGLTFINLIKKRNNKAFVNFICKDKKSFRLEESHIIKTIENVGERGKITKKREVNWDFWRQHIDGFDIYLDEVHNILSSRRSMSGWNVIITQWIAQIRKLLGESEEFNLYMASQRLNAIDVSARELADEIIYCKKIIKNINGTKHVFVINYFFTGEYCMENYLKFRAGIKCYNYRNIFYGNNLFKYYKTHDIIDFGSSVYI